MKIILLDTIGGVGHIGDVKDVHDGYARNYLLPRGLAKSATAGTLKEAELLKQRRNTEQKLAREAAVEVAEKLKECVLTFAEKASASGKLFAAVGKEEIAQRIKEVSGFSVAADSISIPEHAIKTEGDHAVEVKLAPEVAVSIKISVSATK